MAQIILGIATLIAIHSLGLIVASLVTNKWYTDSKKDIGIYGICEHVQTASSFNETYYYYRNKYSYTNSNKTWSNSNSSREQNVARLSNNPRLMKKRRNNIFLITSENSSQGNNTSDGVPKTGILKKSITNSTKCYQLIWPDSQQAYQYLTVKTSYKITLMGVSICSFSFALLTSVWSIICALLNKVGTNIRANEVLVGLSIITDLVTILTFLLFLCKEDRIHQIEFYGYSFWLSVAASGGYFLSSILFILNRINLRFMYMLRNYEDQSAKSLN